MIEPWARRGAAWPLIAAALAFGCDISSPDADKSRWTQLGLDGELVLSVADTPWGLYAGTQFEGIFRYDPEKEQWDPLGLDHAMVSVILFVPDEPPQLLAGFLPYDEETTPAAVFSSGDGGRTWTPHDGGLAAATNDSRFWAWSLAVDPADPKRLFLGEQFPTIIRSTDGGEAWEFVSGTLDMFGGRVTGIAFDPADSKRMVASANNAFGGGVVFTSDDAGSTWRWIEPIPNAELRFSDIFIDPRVRDRIWMAVQGRVLRSDDYGDTWQGSLRADGVARLICQILFDGSTLYAVGTEFPVPDEPQNFEDLVVFRLRDGEDEWKKFVGPDEAQGALSGTLDSEGRVIVGTTGSGVWMWTPRE